MEIITRNEAHERGLLRFFTGKPCARGHIAERATVNGVCFACRNARAKTPQYRAYRVKYEKSEKGRAAAKRHAQTAPRKAHIQERNATRTALYSELVAKGLPVDRSITHSARVRQAWLAVRILVEGELSAAPHCSPDPNSMSYRCAAQDVTPARVKYRMKQGMSFDEAVASAREAVEATAERRRQAAAKVPRRTLSAVAREHGVHAPRLRYLVSKGMAIEGAIAMAAVPRDSVAQRAREAGLSINTVRARIHNLGWTVERALSTPLVPAHESGMRGAVACHLTRYSASSI